MGHTVVHSATKQAQLRLLLREVMRATASDMAAVFALRGSDDVEVTVTRRGVVVPPVFVETVARQMRRQQGRTLTVTQGPVPMRSYAAVKFALPAGDGLLCIGSRRPVALSAESLRSLELMAQALELLMEDRLGERNGMVPGDARRITEFLHDGPLQLLTHALQLIRRPRNASAGRSKALAGAVEESIAQLRGLMYRLRTGLDDQVQDIRLKHELAGLGRELSLDCQLNWKIQETALSRDAKWELFYIIREALINVSRHAGTRRVTVRGARGGKALDIWIRDQGRGFGIPGSTAGGSRGSSFGLLTVRDRVARLGGTLEISSGRFRGTTLHIRVPAARGPSAAPKGILGRQQAGKGRAPV